MQRITRRELLKRAGGMAAAGGTLPLWGPQALAAQARSGKKERPRLPVTLRDAHLRDVNGEDCWKAIHAVGAAGVEAGVDDQLSLPRLSVQRKPYSLVSQAEIDRLEKDLQAAKVKISALALANRFDQRPDFELEWVKKAAVAAKRLGIPVIRIDVVPKKLKGDEFLKFTIQILRRVMTATAPTGVALGIENHGNTTNDPKFLAKLFNGVKSDRLGLTLDTANFYWYGHPLSKLYDIYERFASKVFHTHLKSIKYPMASREKRRAMGWEYAKYNCPIYDGDIKFRRVLAILRDAGYRNDLCIENESLSKFRKEERQKVLAKEVLYLESLR